MNTQELQASRSYLKNKMKKIIFICSGDSKDASTWSNVPYCFSNCLERKGIELIRLNTLAPNWISNFYNYFIRKVLNVCTGKEAVYFGRTRFRKVLTDIKIKNVVKKHSDADFCIFINCQYYNKYNSIPSLVFFDWSFEYELRKRRKIEPNFFQKRNCNQEREALTHADIVVSMFKVCAEEMNEMYPEANIRFIGGNVINDLSGLRLKETHPNPPCLGREDQTIDEQDHLQICSSSKDIYVDTLLETKAKSKKLLFIGRKTTYLEAAKKLIEAYKILKKEEDYKDFTLDIVGCATSDFSLLPEGVTCYGFLNKSDERDRKIYYDLLLNAKVLVNANPNWGAYSSTIEAMYFYTPVIVSPYKDFVEEFGTNIGFGIYNMEFSEKSLASNIEKIITDKEYKKSCICSHERVKDYSWDNYADKLLKLMEDERKK